MINDWYQAILDLNASPDQTKELAIEITGSLAAEKIITLYKPNQVLTHISGKFAPGPNFVYASGVSLDQNQTLNIGGMDVYTKFWVNEYGIIGLDSALCPVCKTLFTIDHYDELSVIKEAYVQASDNFLSQKSQPRISCPKCLTSSHVSRWQTQPHLGFCHLAFIFWNWPPFETWNRNIPDLIASTLGHEVVLTYGRL